MPNRNWLRLPVVSAGAEYLVMGYLVRRNILTYKAPPNNEGYDLICIHPGPRHQSGPKEVAQVRVQVIHAIQHDAGFVVMVRGGVTFDSPDRRTQARYKHAIAELMETGYLDHVSQKLYEVSAESYQFADYLPSDDGH